MFRVLFVLIGGSISTIVVGLRGNVHIETKRNVDPCIASLRGRMTEKSGLKTESLVLFHEFSSTEASWKDAEYECKNRYFASLATVQSFEEDHLLSQLSLTGTESLFKMLDRRESKHLQCFQKYENTVVLNADYMSPANVYTPSQCLNECINAKTRFQFDCRSVMWFRESSECILNSKSKDEVDSIVSNELSFGVDFYDNECIFDTVLPNTNGVATHRAELQISNIIPGVRSCFTKYRHSSLVGYLDKILDNVTERECLSECWRCGENTQCFSQIDEMCKSVTYYGTSRQCIMTSKTKRVNPGFFDATENLSDFFERRRDCTYENCEDLEIGLIFVLDGSDSLGPDDFNRSLILVDKTITEIHETTEFWRLLVIQLGSSEEPSVVEIPISTFNTLDDMRNSLYSISWRNFSGDRQGESLLEIVQIVDQIKSNYDLDYSWVFFITNGLNFDRIDEFVQIKNRKEFTSFAIGVGDELNFPMLEQLATSNDHLIHAQSPEMVAKQVSAKLCVNNGIVFQSKQTNDWDMTLQNFHENGIRRTIPLKNSALASQTFQLIKEEPVWLGLHRDEFGKMIWDNEAEISEYDQKLLNHLETGVYTGDCILWLQPKKWIQSKCSLKYRYVCNLKPLQTINEKLVQLVNKSTNLPETSLGSTTVSGVEELIPFGVSSATH